MICEFIITFAIRKIRMLRIYKIFYFMGSLPNITKPGELVKSELKERHISQKAFAKAIGVGESHLSDLLSGRRRLTNELAKKIEELLGINSQLLIDIQTANAIVHKANSNTDRSEIESQIAINSIEAIVSVKTLLKFTKKKFKNNLEKLSALHEYYGISVNTSEAISSLAQGCYRKSATTGMDKKMILTWVIMAHAVSHTVKPSGEFSLDKMPELCNCVAILLHQNDSDLINNLTDLLSSYGIGLIRINKVERASIDGYSFFNNGIPYIALTCRYDRIDNLAFTILHELAHIALGHTNRDKSQLNIDRRSYDEDFNDSIEDEANHFASEQLIPTDIWQFAPTISAIPYIIKAKYKKWAESIGLNPWIVLGRLSYETGIYKFPNDEARKINGGKEVCHELVK